jgi:hypothetical protein
MSAPIEFHSSMMNTICESPSFRQDTSSPLLPLSTELFNRLQAFQVYLEMSGTIDSLTDCVAQLNLSDSSSSSSSSYTSVLEQFKEILRAKMPSTIEANCLQQEIDELRSKIDKLRREQD